MLGFRVKEYGCRVRGFRPIGFRGSKQQPMENHLRRKFEDQMETGFMYGFRVHGID